MYLYRKSIYIRIRCVFPCIIPFRTWRLGFFAKQKVMWFLQGSSFLSSPSALERQSCIAMYFKFIIIKMYQSFDACLPYWLGQKTSLLALHAALNQKSTKNRNTSFSIFIMLSAKHLVNWKKQMTFFFLTHLQTQIAVLES